MTTFFLIRHGQKETIMGDPHLTKVGLRQANYTAKSLKNNEILRIYTSPLKRAVETAEIIAQEAGLKTIGDKRLKERMNWGDKKGETREEFIEEWQRTDLDRDYQPTHGDSSRKSGQRLESFINEVSKEVQNGTIAVVTHGGVIGDLLRNIFPLDSLPLVQNPVFKSKYIEIPECSITTLNKNIDKFVVGKIGSIEHLPYNSLTFDKLV